MSLSSGMKLGPYEILAPIGAGGMGEVYRARDTRLDRTVALKILPAGFSNDSDRLQRFEHEARVLSTLNHPNVLAIHDIGSEGEVRYLVSEFLEGQTLRERLDSSPVPLRRVTEYAIEMARGLAAAHEKGIVHRDLKPENIFITKDGRVKILDFGLAKQNLAESGLVGETPTMTSASPTSPGTVLGTVGYMSPEQVRGQAVDHRSDIFSFGAILYEMVAGKRAFKGGSKVETMNAILKEEPPELSESGLQISPGIERVVRHCLEKEPGLRFQSTRDLAFDLESLSSPSTTAAARIPALSKVSHWRAPLLWALPLLLLASAGAFWTGRKTVKQSEPVFTRLSFRAGNVAGARFSPDGQTVVYGAAFGGDPVEIYTTRVDERQSRDLGLKGSSILAVSAKGEMAIAQNQSFFFSNAGVGTLARVPLSGGAPRQLSDAVGAADWDPSGADLAAVRIVEGRVRLDFPLGTMLHETEGWFGEPRFSPDGSLIAYLNHPIRWDSFGSVGVMDRNGRSRTLTGGFPDIRGLAWNPSGKEIWFSESHNLWAVTLDGHQRLVWSSAGPLRLSDISHDGRVLLVRENRRRGIAGLFPGRTGETDLSWQDWSLLTRISPDGKWIYFSEEGDGGGTKYSAYMRATDGSPAILLGEGCPFGLSPDGKWVASIIPGQPQQLTLLPTGVGETKNISLPGFDYDLAFWMTDGQKLLIQGREPGKGTRVYLQNVDGGPLKPVAPEGIGIRSFADPLGLNARKGDTVTRYPYDGGPPETRKAVIPPLIYPQSLQTGRFVIGALENTVPLKLYRFDTVTGQKQPWKEFVPTDRAGVFFILPYDITPDGRYYAYSYVRDLSDLYLVEGLK
ncbi:MAG TPA: protein kinase [Terriglobales bacterium]|nr:protein kinase [Terriglobales bacterium]